MSQRAGESVSGGRAASGGAPGGLGATTAASATSAEIEAAAATLRAGGMVAFPTETVYGLGADALSAAAVRSVFALKGRPARNPLIVHVGDAEAARALAAPGAWDARCDALAAAFWPGPLTVVVAKSQRVPMEVTAGGETVALRVPDHPVARALLARFAGALVGPSANRSGHVSPTTAAHVRAEFGDAVQVLEGGPCRAGIESTVVVVARAAGVPLRVLRPGVIAAAEIAARLGVEVVDAAVMAAETSSADAAPLLAPGMLERHYAPRTPAYLMEIEEWGVLAGQMTANVEAGRGAAGGALRLGLLTHSPFAAALCAPSPVRAVMLGATPGAYAAGLYAALRVLDDENLDALAVQRPPTEGRTAGETALWRAIADRLRRACSEL